MDAPGDSAIGGTYVGNPVPARRRSPYSTRSTDSTSARARAPSGRHVRARIEPLLERVPQLGDVRGPGAMIGLELVRDPATREPAPELATRIFELALERGLILLKAGSYGNVIRNLVPLVISDAELAEALDVLEGAIVEAAATADIA